MIEILTLRHGDRRYAELLDLIRADGELVDRMWADAESWPGELDVPGTWWTVVVVDGRPAAWCAAIVDGEVLKCHSNYEVPAYRGRGLYAQAYRWRHRDVIRRRRMPAVTYLFAAPVGLHLSDGWVRTGETRVSELGHRWYELRRDA